MPLYEYECPKDGRFERVRKFSDPPLTKCPTCGGPVEKLASAPAIQFKGTGWYVTDYARKSGGDESGKDKAPKDTAAKDTAAKETAAKESTKESKDSSAKSEKPAATTSSQNKK